MPPELFPLPEGTNFHSSSLSSWESAALITLVEEGERRMEAEKRVIEQWGDNYIYDVYVRGLMRNVDNTGKVVEKYNQ